MTQLSSDQLQALLSATTRRRQAIAEARGWLLDCFSDEDAVEEIQLLNAIGVARSVEHHYEGGFQQFLTDALLVA